MRSHLFGFLASASLALLAPFSAHAEDWTGVYVGAHLGGGWADVDWTLAPAVPPSERVNNEASGVVGGGQIGVQKQWGPWLAGVELSYTAANLDDTISSSVTPDRSRSASVDDIFLASVRFGYAFDRSLLYAKGGYARGEVELTTSQTSTGTLSGASSKHEDGWHLGGGFEYALAQNISAGLDYDFIRFDGSDRLGVQLNGFGAADHDNVDTDVQVVTARINYRFGRDEAPRPLK